MPFSKNMGWKETVARVLGGVAIVGCSLWQVGPTPLGLVLAAAGFLALLTGLVGDCPACAVAGRRPVDDR